MGISLKLSSIVLVAVVLMGLAETAVALCSGAVYQGIKVVWICHDNNCSGDYSKSTKTSANCPVYCCPDGTSQYIGAQCTGQADIGCCSLNGPSVTPNFACPASE